MKKYRFDVVDYNPDWPLLFNKEKEKLSACISQFHPRIEHIGSTAVPGLAAKPIIDIAVGIEDFGLSDRIIEEIKLIGYHYETELEEVLPKFRFLWKGEKTKGPYDIHRFHVSIKPLSSSLWTGPILFRDYLLSHPEEAEAYGELKQKIFEDDVPNNAAYNKAKSRFIDTILTKARSAAKQRSV